MKEKVHFINVLRLICFLEIIFYHTLIECQTRDMAPLKEVYYVRNGIHLGTVAVSLFFMISGFGLMTSLGRNDKINLGKYYKRRVVRILVPYWISSAIVFFVVMGATLPDYPRWRLIFNVLGLDGYLYSQSYDVFYMLTGEWFVGCLLIIYLVFPIAFKLLKTRTKPFMIVTTVLAAVMILNYHLHIVHLRTAIFTDLYLKTYEFILGMHLATVWKRIDRKAFFASIIVILIYMVPPVNLPLPQGFKITSMAIAMFVIFAYLESWFDKRRIINFFCDTFCKYSYEIFLIHHAAIVYFLVYIWPHGWIPGNIPLIMIIEGVLGVTSGIILHYICKFVLLGWDAIVKMVKRKKEGA